MSKTAHDILHDSHWVLEDYVQRMTVKEWKKILEETADTPIIKGRLRRLVAQRLGFGFVDVRKVPLDV